METINIDDIRNFFDWLEKQPHDYISGRLLYDIKGYYKRLELQESFNYWFDHIYS